MPRFDAARRAAFVHDLLSALTGRPADLLSFDEVKERLRLARVVDRGVREVPLQVIVGTIEREREFNRVFLPREESLRERWDDVANLARSSTGFPPVELYKVGEAYFVVDGHHRVSVARSVGAPAVEAHVQEFPTPVPLAADASLEDVLLREGLADFLAATGLTLERADEYRVTEPRGYERLLDHISVHRYFRGIDLAREFSWDEAVASWRDLVYRPTVEVIRRRGVLEAFPGRTETDLYLYTMEHLAHLRDRYGTVTTRRAVAHFALWRQMRPRAYRRLRDWLRKLRG